MSAISKYSNYAQFQNVNSKVNTMIQFDKSGVPGQIIGSNGATGLVWVDSDPSSASYWSEYPATQTVDISGNDISDVQDIGITGTISNNAKLTVNFDVNNPSIGMVNDVASMNIQGGNMNFTNVASGNQLNIYGGNVISMGNGIRASSLVPPSNDNYNRCFQGNGINSKIFLIIPDNNPIIQLSNEGENIYSRSDLTSLYYNNGTIETVKLDSTAGTLTINDGTDSSVLTTTNLTFSGVPYSRNMINSTLVYSSALIYADGSAPATNLLIRNTYAYNGWYFKNTILSSKINWYFAPQQLTVTSVADIKGLAISFFNGATTSNDNTLFLTIYTIPTGSGDYAPGFFHSSMTYVFDQAVSPVANTNYQGVAICDLASVPAYYETQVAYEESTINNPRGTYLPTDKVLAVVIGSNSASATNSVEFVVSKLNIIMDGFTQSLMLVPP
jgi:hypothetical protein